MATFYTYYSYEEFGRGYIGYHKCPKGKSPETDGYLGSFRDKTFKPTSKIILTLHSSREEAILAEIKIQYLYRVVENPHFANRAYQTSTGFSYDATGTKFTEERRRKMSEAQSGEKSHMYGKKLSKETREKMSKAQLGENNYNYKPRDWYHPVHGEVLGKSPRELVEMFPEQNLSERCLGSVYRREKTNHKGWKRLDDKDVQHRRKNHIPKDWYHGVHGEIIGKSITELKHMFPEQNLSISALSLVANEVNIQHKGWHLLESKDSKKQNYKVYDWYHPDYGEIYGKSAPELAKMFPEQGLRINSMWAVASEKSLHNHGWKLLKNKNVKTGRGNSKPLDWYHPIHGEVKQVSASGLIKMFPGENLKLSGLSQVANRKRFYHKGWTMLPED